jgi:hypothetical protein
MWGGGVPKFSFIKGFDWPPDNAAYLNVFFLNEEMGLSNDGYATNYNVLKIAA